jgi:hypothetical protein
MSHAECIKQTWLRESWESPAGFQYTALTSSATPTKASPIPEGLAPSESLRKFADVSPAAIIKDEQTKKTKNAATKRVLFWINPFSPDFYLFFILPVKNRKIK